MLKDFNTHIQKNFPFLQQHKFLIAISGGVDSVVLAHLCHQLHLDFAFAHCNFQLRGNASYQDEQFVVNLAKKMDVKVYVKKFETKKLRGNQNQSIQLLARELRYHWFKELLINTNCDFLLTAHHLNDNVETFFINLIRGTGLDGLTGIPSINQKIVRPLTIFSRQNIKNFAKQQQIDWREDASNASDNYLRNRIRHHLTPFLYQENADFLQAFKRTQNNLSDSATLVKDYIKTITSKITYQSDAYTYYDIEQLKTIPHLKMVIYELFSPYGFTAFNDIYDLLSAQSGKQIFSEKYKLLKDRNHLVLSTNISPVKETIHIQKGQKIIDFPNGQLICEKVVKMNGLDKHISYIATNKLKYPLTLRPWRSGDRFKPYGMKGHRKLSDFLKDLKLTRFQKENVWVLCTENTIIWVVGYRISEDFKIKGNTRDILKIQWLK